MSKTLINDIKIGIDDGMNAMCPMISVVVVAVNFTKDGKTKWVYNIEVDGLPTFCMSKKDMYDAFLNDEDVDVDKYTISEIENIDVDGVEYEDLLLQFQNTKDDEALLLKLLVYLTNCQLQSQDAIINALKGKYLEDVNYRAVDEFSEQYDEWVAWLLHIDNELSQRYIDRINSEFVG